MGPCHVCGQTANQLCPKCRKLTCPSHMASVRPGSVCVSCVQPGQQQQPPQQSTPTQPQSTELIIAHILRGLAIFIIGCAIFSTALTFYIFKNQAGGWMVVGAIWSLIGVVEIIIAGWNLRWF